MQIEVQFEAETVWLSQQQMANLFGKGRSTVTEHIRNVFREGELMESEVCRKFRHTNQHGAIKGKTQEREVTYYNLDVIISIGYRVKSKQGTQFRIWATSKLKELLVQGYVLNEKRLAQKNQELKVLKDGIQILNRALQNKPTTNRNEWLLNFASGLSLLDDYSYPFGGISKKELRPKC